MDKQEQQNQKPNNPLADSTRELDVVGIEEIKPNGQEPSESNGVKQAPEPTRFEITNVEQILNFINSSLNAQKVGVLDGGKAFNSLVDILNKSIKPM